MMEKRNIVTEATPEATEKVAEVAEAGSELFRKIAAGGSVRGLVEIEKKRDPDAVQVAPFPISYQEVDGGEGEEEGDGRKEG